MRAHVSLASWPGARVAQAMRSAALGASDPLFGQLSTAEVQLVPQSLGQITLEEAAQLRLDWPGTRFRLHANVRVLAQHRYADLSNLNLHMDWFEQAARVSKCLGAAAYTAHAGRRSNATLTEVLDNARRAAELFGCAVGVEGLYPSIREPWLVSSWHEYQLLFESGVPYALDLSHLHILASQTRVCETELVKEMLASPQCLEVHVSHNDGVTDSHRPCCEIAPWWFMHLRDIHPAAVVFSEGLQRRLILKGNP